MANTILITANWHTGALSQQTISRQYDNNRYVVQFVGYPEASDGNELDYYLLVWMSSAPGETPDEIAPIQLASDQWHISNFFTQQTQQIKFQMCALNTEGTFEAHSPIFTGFVRNSLEHDGTTQDIDVSTLFDAYREYLNELIIRSGAVVIDSVPTQGSTNAVSSGGVYDALQAVEAEISDVDDTIIKEQGTNLFDGDFVNGYFANDGSITPHSNWISTENYIDVRGFTAVTTSGYRLSSSARETMNMFYLCTYNESKQFIANLGQVNNTYTVGENVCYIRFSIHPGYYSDIQVESGTTASSYEPYSVEYKFSNSPYLSDYVIDKFNIYDKANNIIGEYINSSGVVVSSSSAVRCLVPCVYGQTLDICRPQRPNYSSGNGLMLVYDSSMTALSSVDMNTYATIEYGTYAAVRYPVTNQNAAFISFNVKLSGYDSTDDTIVTARNINGSLTDDYISEIESCKLWAVNGASPKWKNKKWVVFGDSLTAVNQRTTKHYFDYVAEDTGIGVINMGDSGSGYKAEDDVSTAFYQRIGNVPTDADVITIFGSFNDLGTGAGFGTATDTGTTTIGGCINTTLDNLFTAYPLAVVGIVSPTPWVNANPTNEPNRASQYCDLLKAICERRSIPYLDLFHCSLLRPWEASFRALAYTKDEGNGVHPDETGHKIIAPRIKAFLETLLM